MTNLGYSLMAVTFLVYCAANEEFDCKPRPGCHFTKCDPVRPIRLEDLRRNEYPITCVRKEPLKRVDQITPADPCMMTYNNKCFWVDMRLSGIQYEKAVSLCRHNGGKLANIYSEEHYYMVAGYLRMFSGKTGESTAWMGLLYDKLTHTVSTSKKTPANFVKWFPGYPSPLLSPIMGMAVNMDWKIDQQHMVNANASWIFSSVICEK